VVERREDVGRQEAAVQVAAAVRLEVVELHGVSQERWRVRTARRAKVAKRRPPQLECTQRQWEQDRC